MTYAKDGIRVNGVAPGVSKFERSPSLPVYRVLTRAPASRHPDADGRVQGVVQQRIHAGSPSWSCRGGRGRRGFPVVASCELRPRDPSQCRRRVERLLNMKP